MIMRPLAEITDQAIRALNKELGLADTIRFLNQFRTRSGTYLEEREQLFGEKSLDEILAEIDEDRRRRDE